ncbi:MAG: 23S rRNA (adenine(2503)-C(2))-methyltransferase RlmN [Desulfovibrio sp.]|nr:MAG: 23S rRNA (adenine(2503)-C(2))-methyltransferase RlmN [Desulfovibrio sp.]
MLDILNSSHADLAEFLKEHGQPRYRTDQVFQWLWQKRARDFSAMTNLSQDFRFTLAEKAHITWPDIAHTAVSQDGTVKFLLSLADGAVVETVLIPEKEHTTQCLSTQVGCAMACTFCSTGDMGFSRNMTMAEILGQILVAQDYLEATNSLQPLRNLVFMGMGEPFLNFSELMRSLEILRHPMGLEFSSRRITVSTVGVGRDKDMLALGDSGLASLALSLHAPTQELRERIMPKAARKHLDDLMRVVDAYPLKPRQRLTMEYILLGGVNDQPNHAKQLAKLLAGKRVKINLIAYNPPKDCGEALYRAPLEEDILAFEKVLWDKGFTVILRKSKGADIGAACGQLATQKRHGSGLAKSRQ